MKLLVSADIHGVVDVYEWLIRTAAERLPDAVVLAGDLLGGYGEEATIEETHAREARALAGRLAAMPCPVLYVMGNDDQAEFPPEAPRLIPLHARRVEFPPYNFVGYRYSLPFIGRETEKPEVEIEAESLESEVLGPT